MDSTTTTPPRASAEEGTPGTLAAGRLVGDKLLMAVSVFASLGVFLVSSLGGAFLDSTMELLADTCNLGGGVVWVRSVSPRFALNVLSGQSLIQVVYLPPPLQQRCHERVSPPIDSR